MADTSSWLSGDVTVLSNLAQSLIPVEKMLTGAAYLIGIFFAIKALSTLKTHGEQRSSMSGTGNMKEAIVYLMVAAMLIYFPSGFQALMNSTFGYQNVLSYSSLNTTTPVLSNIFGTDSTFGNNLALIIQVIGLVAFIRGWVMIAKSASGQQHSSGGGVGKALMHIFGGMFAMNIIGTLQIISNTLYGS